MNHPSLNLAAGIACLLLGAASGAETAAPRPVDTRVRTIERLLDVTSTGTGTVSDARELFEDLELEMDLALRVHFPRKTPQEELGAKEEAFVSKVLAHPRKYRSELLRCLRQEWPRLFGGSGAKRRTELAGAAGGPLRYKVTVDSEEFFILFGLDSPVIVGMLFPDGTSLGHAVDRCSGKARVRAGGGARR